MKIDYAARARALVGTPFRPQGRDSGGLDCVGVALAAYSFTPDSVRRNYSLRGDHKAEIRAFLAQCFRRIPKTQVRAGDLMLANVGNEQLHLCIRTAAGFVHAHARVRRVVETPGMPGWPILGIYRKRRR